MPENPDWYELRPSGLRQGDIFRAMVGYILLPNVTISQPPDDTVKDLLEHWRGDWIVLTPSCDAETGRLRSNILLAKILPATPEVLKVAGADFKRRLEVMRQGKLNGRRLLPAAPHADPLFPLSVVECRLQGFAPRERLSEYDPGLRLRLKSPMREQFGNFVGQGFSDVGLEKQLEMDPFAGIGYAEILEASSDS